MSLRDPLTRTIPASSTSHLLSRSHIMIIDDLTMKMMIREEMSANQSPRSNTIPMIELGRSLEQLHGVDTSAELRSLDNLDGCAGLSQRDSSSRTQAFRPAPPGLDNMIGLSEFRKLCPDEQHKLILSLLPQLKPFAAKMDRNLEGLSYSVGLASKQLDLRDTWEKVEREELEGELEAARYSGSTLKLPVDLSHANHTTCKSNGGRGDPTNSTSFPPTRLSHSPGSPPTHHQVPDISYCFQQLASLYVWASVIDIPGNCLFMWKVVKQFWWQRHKPLSSDFLLGS